MLLINLFYRSSEFELVCSNIGSDNLIIALLSSLALFCGDLEADILVISALAGHEALESVVPQSGLLPLVDFVRQQLSLLFSRSSNSSKSLHLTSPL